MSAPQPKLGGGAEVVVLYNSRMPGSKELADYYAAKRDVPRNQVWGFETSTNEEISRVEFRETIQEPLLKKLERSKLWRFGKGPVTDADGQIKVVDNKLVKSDIRYAVLCYGMPLKIKHDPGIVDNSVRPEYRNNSAAVESELAILPDIKRDPKLAGPLTSPVYGVTNAALIHPTNGVLMVTRLDGPTVEIARGLVDKALQAESEGPWGRAYIDLRGTTDPGLKVGDDWIRHAADVCRLAGFETIVDTNSGTFPASFPMSQIGFYCGWYSTSVDGPFRLPDCEFMPGAFAYHLYSFSGCLVRDPATYWVGTFLSHGVTITMGSVYEPFVGGTPNIGVFAARFCFDKFTFGEAAYAGLGTLSWQTTVVGDPLYQPFTTSMKDILKHLETTQSKQIAWWHLRAADIALARNLPASQVIRYLESLPLTRTNAILSEKLGELCAEVGKPSSAIESYERALQDEPSPMQRVRLRLVLGEKLLAADRKDDAYENYKSLAGESPRYPGLRQVYQRLLLLANSLGRTNDVPLWQEKNAGFEPKPAPAAADNGTNSATPR